MVKLFIKNSSTEVAEGKPLEFFGKVDNGIVSISVDSVSKDLLNYLFKEEIIEKRDIYDIPLKSQYYIDKFAKFLNTTPASALSTLKNLSKVNRFIPFSILSQLFIDALDVIKYNGRFKLKSEDKIKGTLSGYIINEYGFIINTAIYSNNHLNPIFRCSEDAEMAVQVFREWYDIMLGKE